MKNSQIDIVIAVRNEKESIEEFVDNINHLKIDNARISLIFVEDGSTDGTVDLLREISRKPNISFFSLKNPYGQGGALSYGILNSKADAVITMDGDKSHPVETIEQMISLFNSGFNVVQGHRLNYKRDNRFRSYFSSLFFYCFTFLYKIKF